MEYIFMDLDGTVTNSKAGITKGIQYALKSMNIHEDNLDNLCKFIGPPLKETFIKYYGFSEDESDKVTKKFREYFEKTGIFENEVYEGMEELLIRLKGAGFKIITATSKPEIHARRILEHFGLAQYFEDICGASFDESRSEKDEVIQYALDKNKITDYSSVVMVGDRRYDVEGAKKIGLKSVGVLFGFGSREELENAGADRISETVEGIYDAVMSF